jgi:hypothetical protein
MHWYTYVLGVCAVCYVEGRDIPTLSRMRFSTESTPFIKRYFFARQNSFSLMTVGARIISLLCRLREASTVLRKSKLFALVQAGALFPGNASHAAATSTVHTTLAYCCVLVDFFNKRLEVIPGIGPIAVSCHSSSA